MLVKDIMTTAVKTTVPHATIGETAATMCFNKISGLPVLDPEGRVVGIISEKDVLRGMYPSMQEFMGDHRVDMERLESEYRDVLHMTVEQLMSTNVVTVPPDVPVLKAVSVMSARRIRRIPVAANGKLVGIISMGDVHKAIFQKSLLGFESKVRGVA
jgi:CBS domain-containing protein